MNIEIDKSEISLMIEQTKKNMEIVKDTTKPYHDADACKYINDVLKNYTEIYHYIKETIKNNIEVFFNLDKLCIGNCSFAAIYFPDVPLKNNVNEMFTIQFRVKVGHQKCWEDGKSLYASVNADSIYDIDPYIDTSDTKKWEHKYSWGYDHKALKLMNGDIVIKSGCKFTAKDWNMWCEKAEWIKKYTEIFVHEFKLALQYKLEQSKHTVSIAIADSVRRDSENKIVFVKYNSN